MIMFDSCDDRMNDHLFPLLAAAVSGIASIIGQSSANRSNAQQAQLNRDFQERMSNTEMQRRVRDLKAAGLNPAMAMAGGQGASAVGGSQAAPMQNPLSGTAASLDVFSNAAVRAAQARNVDADTAGKLISNMFLGPLMTAQTTAAAGAGFASDQKGFLDAETRSWMKRMNENALEVAKSQIARNSAASAADVARAALDRASIPERQFRGNVAKNFDRIRATSAKGWDYISKGLGFD